MFESLAIQGAIGAAVGLLVQFVTALLEPRSRHSPSLYAVYGLVGLVGALLPSLVVGSLELGRSGQFSVEALVQHFGPIWAAFMASVVAIPAKLFELHDRSVALLFVTLYVVGIGMMTLAFVGGTLTRFTSIAAFAGFFLGMFRTSAPSAQPTSHHTRFTNRNWLDGARFAVIGAIAGAALALIVPLIVR